MSSEATSPRSATTSTPTKADYAMGSTDRERQRLMQQGAVLRGFTETALRAAGIAPGMRVLDIGSGVGDVSLLVSDLVGPRGSVLGIDRDAANVAWASRRIAEAGRSNIQFVTTEFADFTAPEPFDALVGRFIMMYLPDPAAALRRFAQFLRSGAIVAFFEPDVTVPSRCHPEIPLLKQCEQWFGEVIRRSGARGDIGMHLHEIYRHAGFQKTQTMVFHLSGTGVDPQMVEFFVEGIRSILPKIEQYGLATREEVEIDTLAQRIIEAGRPLDPQWVSARYIAAWTTKP